VPCALAVRRVSAVRPGSRKQSGPATLGDRLLNNATHTFDPLRSVAEARSRRSRARNLYRLNAALWDLPKRSVGKSQSIVIANFADHFSRNFLFLR